MSSLNETTVQIPDGVVNYAHAGSGPPLLLLHSAWGRWRFWLPVIDGLAEHFTVYAPDMIGHGDSARRRPGYTIPDFAKSVVDFMGAIGVDRAHVVGNSFSGTTSIELAAANPECIEKLVLVAPPTLLTDEEREARLAGFRAMTDAGGNLRPMTLDETRIWFASPTHELLTLVNGSIAKISPEPLELARTVYYFDPLPRLPKIACPTLVLYGDQDNLLGRERILLQSIPDSRLEIFPGAGHLPHLEDPAGFTEVVLQFLLA